MQESELQRYLLLAIAEDNIPFAEISGFQGQNENKNEAESVWLGAQVIIGGNAKFRFEDASFYRMVAGAGYFPTLLSPVLPLGLMFDVWEPKQAVVERSNEVCKRRSSCSGFVSCKKGTKS